MEKRESYDVAMVLGDLGSALDLIPVGKTFKNKYPLSVKWFVDSVPTAGALIALDEAGVTYKCRSLNDDLDLPRVIVVGTSVTASGEQIQWTKFGHRHGIPVIWFEDFFGTGSRPETISVSPDVMAVIHPAAAKIAREKRPGLEVRVCGKPSWSNLPTILAEKNTVRTGFRRELGITQHDILVHWIIGGRGIAGRALEQLRIFRDHLRCDKLTLRNVRTRVSFSVHRKETDASAVIDYARQILGTFCVSAESEAVNPEKSREAILAADLVLGEWGMTDTYVAILAGIPAGIVLFPDDSGLRSEVYMGGVPPILEGWNFFGFSAPGNILRAVQFLKDYSDLASEIANARKAAFQDLIKPNSVEELVNLILIMRSLYVERHARNRRPRRSNRFLR